VPFRRWIADAADGALVGWAVRTKDLDAIAAHLELEIHAGARRTPGGGELRWRSAGIERSATEPSLPFFIEWDDPGQHPSAGYSGGLAVEELVLSGDAGRLASWLGPHALRVDIRSGVPGVVGVVLGDGDRRIAL
jgi:glyoxalase-like protein